jgi:hypothetical protein
MLFECSQRSAADFRMPQFAIARRFFELWQEIEGDVRGLIMRRIRAGHIRAQRSDGCFAREYANIFGGS